MQSVENVVRGHCLCGQVAFEYDGPVGKAGYCHCEDCRRCTGSAFNVSLSMERERLRLLSGQPKSFTKHADSGNKVTRYFCPECGSPLYTASPRHPDYVYVKAGILDDPGLVMPVHEKWAISEVPWSRIPPEVQRFERGTDSPFAQPFTPADAAKPRG